VWVQARPGERTSNIELWMTRPATISGRLLDSTGNPIIGTAGSAMLYRYSYDTSGSRQMAYIPGLTYPGAAGSFVRPDDRGEYRFYDVPPGEYYLAYYGGGQPMGGPQRYYYPGVYDQTKATQIKVDGGEDMRMNTVTFPPSQPFYDVRLLLKDAAGSSVGARRLYIAESMIVTSPTRAPDEPLTVRIAPGSYDVVITNGGPFAGDMQYGRARLEVLNSPIDVEVRAMSAARLTGSVSIERDGKRLAASDIRCRIRSQFGLADCGKGQVVPGPHEIEFADMPADTYVTSAIASGRDIITHGLNIDADTNLEIVLASPGGIAQGVVRDKDGNTIPDAVVALVPDAPRRNFAPHYRSVITDPNGGFEIHGIAPGTYRLFAWTELEGAAYRNAEFMKEFEDKGMPITFEKGGQRLEAELTAF
jgi:hypothetical protein